MTPSRFCGTIQAYEDCSPRRRRRACRCRRLSPAQPPRRRRDRSRQPPRQTAKVAEAYEQFLLGHRLEESDDVDGAIAAYKRAMALDPPAADIPAELADLYLRQNRMRRSDGDGGAGAEGRAGQPEAHRVLGTDLRGACRRRGQPGAARREPRRRSDENIDEGHPASRAGDRGPIGEADAERSRRCSRGCTSRSGDYDKAIPLLADLVKQEPGWQDGPRLLARGVRRRRAQRRGDRLARRGGARRSASCCRRSRTSTSASGAGPRPRTRTSRRCSGRRAASS